MLQGAIHPRLFADEDTKLIYIYWISLEGRETEDYQRQIAIGSVQI
jgi:hypothetical protein